MSFFDLFPPPKLLKPSSVGLQISDTAVRFIELVSAKGHFTVGRFAEKKLATASLNNSTIDNSEAVKKTLSALKEEFRLDCVTVSIPDERSYLFRASIPKVTETEIREAIEFSLEENVPIASNDAVFDYALIDDTHSQNDHLDVVVAVLPAKVVGDYARLIKSAGLSPQAFNIEAQAISQAVVPKNNQGTFLLVNFGEARTSISVVDQNIVQFVSTVSIGSNVLTSAIAKHFSVSIAEAVRIKEEKGYIKNRKNMELFFSLMNTLAAIKDEIGKIVNYWQTHKNVKGEVGRKIGKIVICGRDSDIAGLDEYLSTTLKLPVEIGTPWVNVSSFEDYIPPINFIDALDYAAVIGLALPQNHHV